nr:CAZy families GT19 protein [uncultured Bacteroides sp.]
MVNLIADREVVRELVADTMTVKQIRTELELLLYDKVYRENMLRGYDAVAERLGSVGAPENAAEIMINLLNKE